MVSTTRRSQARILPDEAGVGEYLRSVGEKRGWSQEELVFQCGLHRTYIGAGERGEYNVTLLTLRTAESFTELALRAIAVSL